MAWFSYHVPDCKYSFSYNVCAIYSWHLRYLKYTSKIFLVHRADMVIFYASFYRRYYLLFDLLCLLSCRVLRYKHEICSFIVGTRVYAKDITRWLRIRFFHRWPLEEIKKYNQRSEVDHLGYSLFLNIKEFIACFSLQILLKLFDYWSVYYGIILPSI